MRRITLESVARIIQGGRHGLSGLDFAEKGYPAYGAGGLNGYLPSWEFDEKGIVLSSIGARCGKCFFTSGKWSSLANTQIILPEADKADAKFLFYQLNDENSWRRSGTAQPFIKPSDVKNREIYLPETLDEQRRIVVILDKADAIRQKRQESIRLSEEFLLSAFLEMFGDPMTNPEGWNKVPLKEMGVVTTGNTPSRDHPEYYGDGIEWIKSDNINTPYHFLTKAKEFLTPEGQKVGRIVPENSVLVTCIAGSPDCIGNAALADRPVAFNQQINAVTPFEGTDPFFLYVHFLVAKKLVQQQSTESMKGMVSKGKFENIMFLKPPDSLQHNFGKIFKKMHNLFSSGDSAMALSEDIFKALIQKAFRGEL